jgi:hypothetical protein
MARTRRTRGPRNPIAAWRAGDADAMYDALVEMMYKDSR